MSDYKMNSDEMLPDDVQYKCKSQYGDRVASEIKAFDGTYGAMGDQSVDKRDQPMQGAKSNPQRGA